MQITVCDVCNDPIEDEVENPYLDHDSDYKVDFCSPECRAIFYENLRINFPEE